MIQEPEWRRANQFHGYCHHHGKRQSVVRARVVKAEMERGGLILIHIS